MNIVLRKSEAREHNLHINIDNIDKIWNIKLKIARILYSVQANEFFPIFTKWMSYGYVFKW